MRLEGRIAVVTGGARGIGQGISRRLAAEGAALVVADLDQAAASALAEELRAGGGTALALSCNVTHEGEVARLCETVSEQLGRLDILVNNAGVGQRVVWTADLDLAEWERVIAVNLSATFLCSKHAARLMMKQGYGRIICISSINALGAFPLVAAYNAAKWGVIGLTKTLANELGPYQITVNAICPGPVDTDFQRSNVAQRAAVLGISPEEYRQRIQRQTPTGRWTRPEDIGNAVAFLASEEARNITGAVLPVTGGMDLLGGIPPAWPGAPWPQGEGAQ